MEETELYRLITKATKSSFLKALRVCENLSEDDIQLRSEEDLSSFLHVIVSQAPDLFRRYQSLTCCVPLIYRLVIKGVNVNAQNAHGNTCLHLACIKPNAQSLTEHFIRIGVDPTIANKKHCRVIHTLKGHKCCIVKGQTSDKSGLWKAIEKEDLVLAERLLKSWCRVNIRKNKSLRDVADESGNIQALKLLTKYESTNEAACAAYACDINKFKEVFKSGGVNVNQHDEACDTPKPLLIAIAELGDVSLEMVETLQKAGYSDCGYSEKYTDRLNAFENSELYQLIEDGTEQSLHDALALFTHNKVDVTLTSNNEDIKGWTYLHYVVDRYNKMKTEDEEKARLLIRMIYRLALAGIEVNVRDANERTALIIASQRLDQALMAHVIRIGGDPSLVAADGRAVNEEVYEDKGKLVFDKKYRQADLPGLWVAVATDDEKKAERYLKSWARVNTTKGDRKLIDVARALKRKKIVKLLEDYEHINEFVSATFACDIKHMMNLLALGKGEHKVNTIDDFFHVGFTWDGHAEFMPRPIIISALELCTPETVDFLLKYGANLSGDYEECTPCGPIAFWAYKDHVNNENAAVVANHADVELRDELGCTMLHRAVQKNRSDGKIDIIQTLLDRGIDIAARDFEGSTARDYIIIHGIPDGAEIMQVIDNHIVSLASNDQYVTLENLKLSSYDHIDDVRGTKKYKFKSAREIAELKEYKDTMSLFKDFDSYQREIELLHQSARSGDIHTISKLAGEKRYAFSRDLAGRTLLHNAVLHEHPDICKFLVEQFPHLINDPDSLRRTPLHYCVTLKERGAIWPILQDGGADPNLTDVNNLSVYDYVRECEIVTPVKDRPRGRRCRNYRPDQLIETERNLVYGSRIKTYQLYRKIEEDPVSVSLCDLKAYYTPNVSLIMDDLDIRALKLLIDNKREELASFLLESCGCRPKVEIQDEDNNISLLEYAEAAELDSLTELIKSKCQEISSQRI